MKKTIGLVVSLTIISGVCAGVLAYVDSITKEPIKQTAEKNREAAKKAKELVRRKSVMSGLTLPG